MNYVHGLKLLICSLNRTSSDTTGHATEPTDGVSDDCFDFVAAFDFDFDGMADYRTSTVSNRGGIVSIRSYIVVNRSAAVMSRSGSVDESCRHRRSIVRHRIDAGFSFFHSDASRFYHQVHTE